MLGGLLQDDVGRVSWLGLARSVASALATVGYVLEDASGGWEALAEEFQQRVEGTIEEDEIRLNKA
jgi:hypothetical protein